jgi:hypothetical protein
MDDTLSCFIKCVIARPGPPPGKPDPIFIPLGLMDDTDEEQYQITVACPQAVALEGKEKGS